MLSTRIVDFIFIFPSTSKKKKKIDYVYTDNWISHVKNVAVNFVTGLKLKHLTAQKGSYRVWFAANADC